MKPSTTTKPTLSTGILALLCAAATASANINIDTVTVGDPGNANDIYGFGGVSYTYAIGTYEVNNSEYTAFLNAVDPSGTNPNAVYDASMGSDAENGGIIFTSGAAIGAKYAAKAGFESKPVIYVSFLDAMRFANWLNNGQGAGSTETGSYTLSLGGLAPRIAGASIVVASEDEWVKAAYYDPTKGGSNYWLYPTQSDSAPGTTIGSSPNQANYSDPEGGGGFSDGVREGGAYSGSASHYGTFDQGGNVWELNETVVAGFARGFRGGAWTSFKSFPNELQSDSWGSYPATEGTNYIGFRIAIVPEPASAVLLLGGGALLALRRRRSAAGV